MKHRTLPATLGRTAALGALLLACAAAQAQNGSAQARVLSSTPLTEQGQVNGYSVEYEYAGQRYTTRLPQPPGATLPVQVTPLGVSTYPVAPQEALAGQPLDGYAPPSGGVAPWAHVQPEAGVVRSGNEMPAPSYPGVYSTAVPVAPVYVYPQPQVYAYPYPYPPVNLSFSLGYSRGWGGGWRGGHHRGWR